METFKDFIVEPISVKQYCQFVRFARETQPYLPFKDIALVRLIAIAAAFCTVASRTGGTEDQILRTKVLLNEFKNKYYPYGFKSNNKALSPVQYQELKLFYYPRFYSNVGNDVLVPYNPMEKVVVIRLWRSCYRFITNMEQVDNFITELILTANLIKEKV